MCRILSQATPTQLTKDALIYQALLCGLKDYVEKNGFKGVLLGLSGGVDSALTLCLAVDALGASRVQAILMPSRYTADMSLEDAMQQAEAMQVKYTILPIEPAFKTLLTTLAPSFKGLAPDITEENLDAKEIIARGYKAEDVFTVIKLIKRNEYKRRQAAPGVKISPVAFGRDWRYPITSGYFNGTALHVPKMLLAK